MAATVALASLSGCGPQFGGLFYFMGVGRHHKVPAEFTLGTGPLLILVDDLDERLTWGPARERLTVELVKELTAHGAAEKVISPATLKRFRRTRADFDDLKCTQVGRLVHADQVLWIEVLGFFASEEIRDVSKAASISVAVRVINPHEREDRHQVRLWPREREGRLLKVDLRATEVNELKTKNRIVSELAHRMAVEIAKLFYEHPLQDDEA